MGSATPAITAQSASSTPRMKYCVAMNAAIERVMLMR